MWKWSLMGVLLISVLYVGSYILLSLFGDWARYDWRGGAMTRQWWPKGVTYRIKYVYEPVPDENAFYVESQMFEMNWLGRFYYPLVLADRRWWHPDLVLSGWNPYVWR